MTICIQEDMKVIQSSFFSAFFARKTSCSIPVAIIAMPICLLVVTLRAWEAFWNIKLLIFAHPVGLLIVALRAWESFGHISITVQASPIGLFIPTFAGESFGVIEVTVVTPPTGFFVAAFAGESFGNIPPVGWVASSSTSLHCVSSWIAKMASRAGPVCLFVLAGVTRKAFFNSLLAILAIPLHSIYLMLILKLM